MHVLLFAHRFSPYRGVGAVRWNGLVTQLARKGVRFDIITAAWPQDEHEQHHDQHHGIRVHRLPLRYPLVAEPAYAPGGRFGRAASAVARRILNHTTHARDSAELWSRAAASFGRRLHRQRAFHGVIATGPPFTPMLAAAKLAREAGVPLIVDYRDLWSDDPAMRWSGSEHEELSVLKTASAVVATSDLMRRRLLERAPESRVVTILNGFDPEAIQAFLASQPRQVRPEFDFVYTGTMFLGRERVAEAFLSAVRRVEGVRVAMMGRWPDALPRRFADLVANERLVLLPPGTTRDAWSLVRRGRVGLSFATEGAPWSIASKIYEYAALQRPVASFAWGGAADELVARSGLGFVITPEALDSLEQMAGEIQRIRAAATEWRQPDLTPFSRETAADAMFGLLQETFGG